MLQKGFLCINKLKTDVLVQVLSEADAKMGFNVQGLTKGNAPKRKFYLIHKKVF